ncbi:Hsp20/alpha crystallin family protein [Clostridium tertium]|uniref:Hsp20/alpha crystallin family protein n=1 Tax=Clostridium tertium TaxID=1559 RepID=UPI001AE4105A|nr:Hsp20/alpha crystallin family protein [Clostridium tertium]MBP1869672.1 HSP20 family molecular chaperone IbpA [Clostridium tertium]
MFEMFPFLISNMMGGMFNGAVNNRNNNMNNGFNNSYQYSSFNSGSDMVGIFGGTFSSVFNQVFTTLITNENLINNIVDTVLNNDVVNSVLESIDDELDLDFIDYGDRYLIEGKLVGFDKKDIDIDYEEDHIRIKVKRNQVFNNENSMIAVFQEGSNLEKSFYVPNIEANKIQAVYNADVLRVYLKKRPAVDKDTTIIDVESFSDADDIREIDTYIDLK